MMNKDTLVIGASPNPERYAYKAVSRLMMHGYKVYPLGNRKGSINGEEILREMPQNTDIHTVSIYLRPELQKPFYHDILKLRPKRIIMNPGTFNQELKQMAEEQNIEVLDACTLVMLSAGTF